MRSLAKRPCLALPANSSWSPRIPSASSSVRRFSDFEVQGNHKKGGKLGLCFAVACLPHPEKVHRGGEDGYFASPRNRTFGVADGVGGWTETGVDPGAYARQLLQLAVEVIDSSPPAEEADLSKVLDTAAEALEKSGTQGGSTVLLGQLNGSTMTILNLGDSGVMLLRPATRTPPNSDKPMLFPRVIFRSSDQTHFFNCPYQVSSGRVGMEVPDLVQVRVRNGDLVIAGTDGVFDNLFDHQVQAIVARHLVRSWVNGSQAVSAHLPGLAMSLAKQAQRIGQQEDHKDIITPFTLAAHSEGLFFRGGKLDDTTVVIGLVCSEEEAAASGGEALIHNFNS